MCTLLIFSVNTKAEIRFHVESADWIVPQVKERLQKLARYNFLGFLIKQFFSVKIVLINLENSSYPLNIIEVNIKILKMLLKDSTLY